MISACVCSAPVFPRLTRKFRSARLDEAGGGDYADLAGRFSEAYLKKLAVLVFALGSCMAVAQETPDSAPQTEQTSTVGNPINSLAGEFLHGNYVNLYGLVNGIYDSTQQTLQTSNNSGGGITLGGGILASHGFSSGQLSLNYRGDYRNYTGGSLGSGTDQYLNLIFTKRLSRRWSINLTETAGTLFYSNAYYNNLAPSGGGVQTNPFSSSTRFLQSGVYLTYRQTQRLTYTFGGSFFLNRYNYAGAIGSTGVIGSISPSYALTARTSIGGTYSHDYFVFQHNAGTTNLDGGYFNVSHIFGKNWRANLSGWCYTRAYLRIDPNTSRVYRGRAASAGICDRPLQHHYLRAYCTGRAHP